MKAKIVRYNTDTGKTLETYEENVVITLGEYPEELPVVSINIGYNNKLNKNQDLNIQLNIEELQKEISLIGGLNWLKNHRNIKVKY